MGILIQILQLILSLSILVLLHELGHFFFARLFKTRVEKFYLFFNPWFSLFKYKRGDTEWGIGWLPLGGYCKISGMIDESMDKEQMAKPPQNWEFRSKKAWQRLLIISGGVLVNFVLALIIYSMILFVWGKEYLPVKNAIYGVEWNDAGHSIGLKDGDKVISVDAKKLDDFKDIQTALIIDKAKNITIERGNKQITLAIPDNFEEKVLENREQPLIRPLVPFIVDSVIPGKPGAKAGLKKNDVIMGINNDTITTFNAFVKEIKKHKNKQIDLLVKRDSAFVNLKIQLDEEALVGAGNKPLEYYFKMNTVHYTFFESIPAGVMYGLDILGNYVKQLRLIFSSAGVQSLGGFGTIGGLFPKEWDWESFWTLTALLSIILAFMNVLPIPALDGGHIMFIFYEMISGRKPSDKFMEYAQIAGMIILLSLLVFANGNDIFRAITK